MSATDMVLATRCSFVALELSIISPRRTSGGRWIRLSRAARAQNALMRVSVPCPIRGSAADLVVPIERSKPVWILGERGPRLLRGLEVDLTVRRRKGARRDISGEMFLARGEHARCPGGSCLFGFPPLAARIRSDPTRAQKPVALLEKDGAASLIIAVGAEALRRGIRAGLSVSQARALYPDLLAKPRDRALEPSAQEALLLAALELSPMVEHAQ